jgi:phosphohistidine phosphatase
VRIYLMRHATAEVSGSGPDATRRLTEHGRREAREAGKALLERKATIAIVLSSPLIRARETAELVAVELGSGVKVEIRAALGAGATGEVFREEIEAQADGEVLLVGHNPDLSAFASSLVRQIVGFRPSTVCCFEIVTGAATLLWSRHPDTG